MVALKLAKEQQPGQKEALDVVWVDCPRVLPTLRKALEGRAEAVKRIDGERRPPRGGDPSLILVCLDDKEDVAEEVKRLKALAPEAPILAFTSRSVPLHLAEEALRAGASGFVHAGMRPERIALALSLAKKDEVLIPRELLGDLLGRRLFLRLPRFLDP